MELKIKDYSQQKLPDWLVERLDGDRLLARMLYNRGIKDLNRLEDFLNPYQYQPTANKDFAGLEAVTDKIFSAFQQNLKICIYGDYDVDGITSTAILYATLQELGGQVEYYIPHRVKEGYGLNKKAVEQLNQQGVDLLITCDCGISNRGEVALAKELGMEVIITDHHQLPEELPPTEYILTPKFLDEEAKGYNLPGAGIAFVLATALLEQAEMGQSLEEELLAFLALAIVADVVPLHGDNRYFLQRGLKVLNRGCWPGISALAEVSDLDLTDLSAEDIAFQLAPRLNATGRIAKAGLGVDLLLAKKAEAKKLAQEINQINERRKLLSEEMTEQALEMISKQVDDINQLKEPIILYQGDWHSGIVGIAAGRLKERFHLPVLLLSDKKDKTAITGSARSITGVHLYHALSEVEDLLIGFGGHEKAAGFSLTENNLAAFKTRISRVLSEALAERGYYKEITVDAQLDFKQLNLSLHNRLFTLAPFGEGNPVPSFLSRGVKVLNVRSFADDKHLSLVVDDGTKKQTAIWWRGEKSQLKADKFDLIYSLRINQWQNMKELQLEVKEVIPKVSREEISQPEINLFDYRNWRESGKQLPEIEEGFYFYEGDLKKPNFLNSANSGNRYQVKETENLVLLSCPAQFSILEELVHRAGAKNLLLAYSDFELRTGKKFLKRFAALIKTIIKHRQAKTTIEELAVTMGIKEETAMVALRLLREKGLISFEIFNFNNILLIKKAQKVNNKRSSQQQKLFAMLNESRAFRRYMLRTELDKIKNMLIN